MINIITKKTVPSGKRGSSGTRSKKAGRSKSGTRGGGKKLSAVAPKKYKADDHLEERDQTKQLHKIAEMIGGMASQVALENMNAQSEAAHETSSRPERGSMKSKKRRSELSLGNKGKAPGQRPTTTDFNFLPRQPNLDNNISAVSQEFQYLNDQAYARASARQRDSQRDKKSGNGQLRKVYGNLHDIAGFVERESQHKRSQGASPGHSPSRQTLPRPDSSGVHRITSDDPRLKGLETIYLQQFGKHGSSQGSLGGLKKKGGPATQQHSRREVRHEGMAQTLGTDGLDRMQMQGAGQASGATIGDGLRGMRQNTASQDVGGYGFDDRDQFGGAQSVQGQNQDQASLTPLRK